MPDLEADKAVTDAADAQRDLDGGDLLNDMRADDDDYRQLDAAEGHQLRFAFEDDEG